MLIFQGVSTHSKSRRFKSSRLACSHTADTASEFDWASTVMAEDDWGGRGESFVDLGLKDGGIYRSSQQMKEKKELESDRI